MSETKKFPPKYQPKDRFEFLSNPHSFLYRDTITPFPHIFQFNVLWRKVYVIQNPTDVKAILQEESRNYRKSRVFKILATLLGKGLLTSEGDFWKKQRRLIQPAFHKHRLEEMVKIAVNSTEESIQNYWSKQTEPIDFGREMVKLTIEILTKALFGEVPKGTDIMWAELNKINQHAIHQIRNPIAPPMWLPLPSHLKIKESIRKIDKIVLDLIQSRRQSTAQHHDLLTMLLETEDAETGEKMSDRQIRDEVMTLFIAGHETSVNVLSWTIYELGRNPEALHNLEAELGSILGGKSPNFEDLGKLTTLNNVLSESMRLHPAAYAIPRQANLDCQLGDVWVKKDSPVLVNVYALHRHPLYWDAPNDFVPSRFENLDMRGERRWIYLPFGGGQRQCIGNNFALLEMQVILSILLQRLSFDVLTKETKEDFLVTLRPKTPIIVKTSLKNR